MSHSFIEDIIDAAGRSGIDFLLDGDKLTLRMLQEKTIGEDMLALIREHKESIKLFLRERGESGGAAKENRRIRARKDRNARVPLSFSQERLWFIDKLQGSTPYNMPWISTLRGQLNVGYLQSSFQTIIGRHEVLRTVIREEDGIGYPVVLPTDGWRMDILDMEKEGRPVEDLVAALIQSPFDLSKDFMLKVWLIKVAAEEHILVTLFHHIAFDGWSGNIIVSELEELYKSYTESRRPVLKELPIQYADYAVWQRDYLSGEYLHTKLAYWKEQLQGIEPLELPVTSPRPAIQSTRGGRVKSTIGKQLADQLQAISREEDATLFMTLLSAFHLLLHKYTGQKDICIGSPIAGRQQEEVEGLIGFFVNTLALRTQVDDADSFKELLSRVKKTALDAYEHQDIPFEKIVEALGMQRDMSRTPVFQVLFTLQNIPDQRELKLGDVALSQEQGYTVTTRFDIDLEVSESTEGLQLSLTYCSDLFEQAAMQKLLSHYEELLRSVVADTNASAGSLNILGKNELLQLVKTFNETSADYPVERTVIDLFAEQAVKTPEAIAVVFGGEQLTYQELDERSGQLAHYLLSKGVKNEMLVPVCVDRSVDMLVGIFGIWKAGAAYVPIDPSHPSARIKYMLEDTVATIAICHDSYKELFGAAETIESLIVIDGHKEKNEIRQQPVTAPPVQTAAGNLSYVIYTSGSTGQPKGVMIEHKSLLNFLCSMQAQLQLTPKDSIVAITTYSFDISCLELYASLISGGTVYIAGNSEVKDGYALRSLVEKVKPSYMQATPSGWQLLLEAGWRNADGTILLTGGEAITEGLKETLTSLSTAPVYNMYGPTETTIWSCTEQLSAAKKVTIGKPIANTQVYILSDSMQVCPVGVYGEICIGGDGVSRGYLHKEELTREKFISLPFLSGKKIYRTGDIGRWLPDGSIEYSGRKDEQVKVRGYRIELGEVQSVLDKAPGIEQAVVVAAKDNSGSNQLIAYIVKKEGYDKVVVTALLRDQLPVYMIPGQLVEVASMPLTPNGKIDRKKLRELELNSDPDAYETPGNETEEELVSVWEELLEAKQISIHDNFFEIGGHSLLAMRMVSQIRKRMGKEVTIREVFVHSTVASLAAHMISGLDQQVVLPMARYERNTAIPLSFSQERLWFIDKLHGSIQYHLPYLFRLHGELDMAALEASFRAIINRHEILRTVICEDDGIGYQHILPADAWQIGYHSLEEMPLYNGGLRSFINPIISAPFDLSADSMVRISLLRISSKEHILVAVIHHIAFDGWSIGIMVNELVELYRSYTGGHPAVLQELPLQYADYALWQRNYLEGKFLDAKLDYWKRQLKDAEVLELPTDMARPVVQSINGALYSHTINSELLNRLQSFSQGKNTTLFMTLLAAFNVLLYRYSGQDDICVGSPAAGRGQQELEGLIGFFVNTLALRTRVDGAVSFDTLLQQVKQVTLDAYEHQDIPFERIVEALDVKRELSRTPVFQVMFALQNAPHSAALELGDIVLTEEDAGVITSRFDLGFSLTEVPNGLQISVTYCRDLYYEDTIKRMVGHYEQLLQAVISNSEMPVRKLRMLDHEEEQYLLQQLGTSSVEYQRGETVISLFQQQVKKTPDAIALVFDKEQLTYQELDEYSKRVAHYLVSKGVKREEMIPISVLRSLECIIGILGILKAGGVYVPVDTQYPAERIAYILKDTACRICLGDNELQQKVEAIDNSIQVLDIKHSTEVAASSSLHIDHSSPEQLVYIIYTSGSTGLPKGVMLEHRHLTDHIYGVVQSAALHECRSFALFASLVADAGHSIVFASLLTGASLHVLPDTVLLDGGKVLAYLEDHRIDCLKIVPSLWLSYIDEACRPLPRKAIIFGGESFALNILDILREADYKGNVFNHYGPTETTIGKCIHKIDLGRNYPVVPIGRPFSNTYAYIVDADGQCCPAGVAGELWLGGEGIARGYLNRKGLTKEKFIADPFRAGGRVYRTGDSCRWLADGNIEYLGRKDDQVKIRGYRIELGEIQNTLQQAPGVVQAIVMVAETGASKQLAAYITAQSVLDKDKVTTYLQSKLPEYMVPSVITQLDAIPLLASGKTDRKKLQQLAEAVVHSAKEYVAPVTALQETIAGVWQDLLRIERIGIRDNFFESGGDSIITIQVVSRLKRKGYELQPRDLFMYQTIERLSAVLSERASSVGIDQGEQGLLHGDCGLLPVQQMYFEGTSAEVVSHFNQSVLVSLDKTIAADQLEAIVKKLVEQHDALRFVYAHGTDGWSQQYGIAEGRVIVEKTGNETTMRDAVLSIADRYQRSLDIEKGELIRVVLIETTEQETHNRLLMVVHHLAIDSVSWRIILEDIERLLEQQQNGQPLSLGAKTGSYRQWYKALDEFSRSRRLQSQLPYWREATNNYSPLPVDQEYTGAITQQDFAVAEASLSSVYTKRLLQQVPKAYHTEVNDVLLAVLTETLCNWSGSTGITIGLEGHGREDIGSGTDLSHTVGWFTSLYPVSLRRAGENGALLKSVKEHLRQIPGKGIGYGVLTYTNKASELKHKSWDVVFNYLGQTGNIDGGRWISAATEPTGPDMAKATRRNNKMEIVCVVEQEELKIKWNYSSKHYKEETMTMLAGNYVAGMEQLIDHCLEKALEGAQHTPSDFGLGNEIAYEELDRFIEKNKAIESVYRLSPLQQGMHFHGLYDKASTAYIEQFSAELVDLDIESFTRSWSVLLQRHTILSSAFYASEFSVPVQAVHRNVDMPITILDYRDMDAGSRQQAISEYAMADRKKGFDFTEPPLMRITLMQIAEDRYRIVWTFHHILFDGWSMAVLMEEFLNTYRQLVQQETPAAVTQDRYEDYIRYIENRDKEQEDQYWQKYLRGIEQPSGLPFIKNNTQGNRSGGHYREELLELGSEFNAQLQAYTRRHRITVNTVMQAVWSYLLYRYTGSRDVVYGVTVSGRPGDLPGVEQRIGMYINTLPFRTAIDGDDNIEWLQRIQKDQLSSREYQYSSLVDIRKLTEVEGELFDTIIVFENYPVAELLSSRQWALKVEDIILSEHNNYPLSVEINTGETINIRFNFNEALLEDQYVKRMAGHFRQVLEQFILGDGKMSSLDIFSKDEESQLLYDFNDTRTEYPSGQTVIALFEEQVRLSPDAMALVFEDEQLSYRQLDARAAQLAHYLLSQGVQPGELVPVCMNRSAQLIVSLLTILKAGGAYVPVDPSYPAARIEYMLKDIGSSMLLTESFIHLPAGALADAQRIDVDQLPLTTPAEKSTASVTSSSIAYVLYTSGTTGTPKGVQVTNQNIVSLVKGVSFVDLTNESAILSTGSPSFDATTIEYWGALLNGGKLVMCAEETLLDPTALQQQIEEQGVTLMWFTAGWFNELVETSIGLFATLKTIIVGGDKLSPIHIAQVREAYPDLKIVNGYGPTENTTFSLTYNITSVDPAADIAIGYPLSNRKAYILDEQQRLCPIGVTGELYVGGAGLSPGYLHQPALTAEKFIADPFDKKARLYRTGDLGRWRADGAIDYRGRKDEQLKIRGYRIEPGEIENVLQQAPGVQQAVVLGVQGENSKRLVAYVVTRDGLDEQAVRTYVQDRLPDYMVPSSFIELPSIPLTANGKTDRRQLQELEIKGGAATSGEYKAPRNETERLLAEHWQELLEVERIGVHDNFFEAGGHSLLAIRVIASVRSVFGKEVGIKDLFDHPTISELAQLITGTNNNVLLPSIERRKAGERIPLSFAQERLWFIDRLQGSVPYHMPWVFRLEGALDKESLEASFRSIIDRHEILRTVIREEEGIGQQVILPAEQWQLQKIYSPHTDDKSIDLLLRSLIGRPFDLAKDFMLRVWLIEVSQTEHILLTVFHHIAFDGWSIRIMVEELSAIYHNKTAPLHELPIQYADYAVWQRTHLSGELLQTKLNYWKSKLQHTEPLELPADRVRPLVQSMNGKIARATLTKELTGKLNLLSREEGSTLFMTLLSAFNILIFKYTYHSDICIGTPIAGRQQQEVEGLIGFFVNTLALRNEIVKEQTFRQVLCAVKQTTLEAYEHQDVPFEKIVDALGVQRDMSRTPVFQVMFTLENMPESAPLQLGNATLTEQNTGVVNAKFDLGLTISESADTLQLGMTYCSDLFYDDTITRMLAHYKQVLELLVAHTDETIGSFTIATKPEEQQLLHEFSNCSETHEPSSFSLQDEMDRQMAANGDDIAICYKDRSVSYTQLQSFIDKVCGCLRNGYGFTKGQRVVLLLNRSEKLVMSVFALLRSGLVYIPIDASYPEERVLYMIRDAQPALVIAEEEWAAVLAPHGINCTGLDTLLGYQPDGHFCEKTSATDEAYIIYTSGSTGMPKGVIVTHGNLDHLFEYIYQEYCSDGRQSMPFIASHAFDISLLQLYAPVLSGGSVRVVDQDELKDIEQLVSILQKTTVIDTVPGLYKLILQYIEEHQLASGFAHIRRAFVGGDLIPDDLLHKMGEIFSNADIVISYGPTEGTVFCTQYVYAPGTITSSVKGTVIGRPLNKAEVYVLGPSLEILPMNIDGEICIGGPSVSKGYLNQPEQTDHKYVANPYNPGTRIYRTGDVGRWTSSGLLEFRGRNDNQVKVRGNRIELGELENRIKALDTVKEAVVVVVRKPNMDLSLCAFYTGTETTRDVLEAHLARFFSESVLPSQYIHIDQVPLTANGKVDRKTLQQTANDSASNNKAYVAPRNETEETLATVWQELLGADRAGIHDNFFELGGDSIITIQAVSRLKQKGYVLHPRDIFQHQTIARLSVLLAQRGLNAAAGKGEQGQLQGACGLLPVQQWYLENATGAISHFNQSALLAIDKKIGREELQRIVEILVGQHDALRFLYTFNDGRWTQEYGNKIPSLITEETSATGASLAEAINQLSDIHQANLDITKGELIRTVWIKTAAEETHNRFLMIVHHLAMDGVSWRILLQDMEQLLNQQQQGIELSLGAKGTSCRQWYDTLMHYSKSRRLIAQLPYWENAASLFTPLPYDINETASTVPARATHTTHLSAADTELLLQQVPKAYHTEINDLLLAALTQTLGKWSGNEQIVIGLEGHGREDMMDTDLSRTIGWFTSVFPAVFNLEGISREDDLIKSVKEQIRAIPGKGLGYGVLKYFNKEVSLQGRQPWEVVFNYLGQVGNLMSGQWITAAQEPTGTNIAVTLPSDNKMEIVSLVQDGVLEIKWNYDTKYYRATTIEQIAKSYTAHLKRLVNYCMAQLVKGPVSTPSDYGLGKEIGYKELDAFTHALPDGPSIESMYRLSSLQQGMLFHGLYDHSSGSYIEQFCAGLTDVDLDAFTQSWQQLMKRHSVLRSGFYSDALSIPVQCVYRNAKLDVVVIDYRSLNGQEQEEAIRLFEQEDRAKGFDFQRPPLMRVTLLQLQERRYRMIWTFHHILFDGWSMPVLMEEFLQAYEELSEGAHPNKTIAPAEDRYEEYIRYIETRDSDKEEIYWSDYLAPLERGSLLPFISNTTERNKGRGVYQEEMLVLDEATTARIQLYARDHRLTVNTIMQGVWAYLLYRYTGSNDVVYGVTVSGRPDDLPGVEKSVGLYINTLPLYAQVSEDRLLLDWLQSIQQSQLASREYQHSSLTRVQEWSGVKGELFDTLLVFENYPVAKVIAAHPWKLQVENLQAKGKTNYPLSIIIETSDKITACFKYNSQVLDAGYVKNINNHFRQVVLQMTGDPARTIGTIDMLTQEEKQQLLQEFNRSAVAYPEQATMTGLFEEQAARHPDTMAIVSINEQLTYRQLNERSNQLANYLQSIGVKERSLVPLCMDKPLQMIVAILGILKAGAAYVPLDPESPRTRLGYMMEETGSDVVLTTTGCSHLADRDKIRYVIELDGDDTAVLQQSMERPVCTITPDDPLYVIYTSGSTGNPKGVMIRHRSIVDYVFGLKEKIHIGEHWSFALVSAIFTDLGNTVIYSSLMLGGTLHVFDKVMTSDPERMCRYFETHAVDCLKIVPSHFKALSVDERMPLPLKWLVFGGEALQAEMVEKIATVAQCRIANHYGPTETTVGKMLHIVQPSAAYRQTIPIGRPFSNTYIYVLSAARQLCPIGVPGELYIGGTGVAQGYINNRELTDSKFINDPFDEANGMVYRTGDQVKYLPDGNVSFIGRADNQVKIRGYRVELGEIESVLQQAPAVTNAVVLMQEDERAGSRLVAFVTGSDMDKETVLFYLRDKLPDYMIPVAMVQVDAMPLTSNGKVDRKRLPMADLSALLSNQYVAPRNEMEMALAGIWQELLGAERIGIHDNFFELGGNSLLIMRMDGYIKKRLKIAIPITILFRFATIDEISKYLEVELREVQEEAEFDTVNI